MGRCADGVGTECRDGKGGGGGKGRLGLRCGGRGGGGPSRGEFFFSGRGWGKRCLHEKGGRCLKGGGGKEGAEGPSMGRGGYEGCGCPQREGYERRRVLGGNGRMQIALESYW